VVWPPSVAVMRYRGADRALETRRQKKPRAALTDECQHEALANFKAERAPLRSRVNQGGAAALHWRHLGGTSRPEMPPKSRKCA
jgi:hypothetical protein